QQGHGAPADTHPNNLQKGLKVNFDQRMPYSTVQTSKKTIEYEAIVEVFSEALEFQRIEVCEFIRLNPGAYEEVRVFADVLPMNAASPAYPFAGFMFNLRVSTDAHKDRLDKRWCLLIYLTDCEGGAICLYELGFKLNCRTGHILIFPSCYITHFNTHFIGLRATLVLHTDLEGDKWDEDSGGW
ncbi:hypothetical protein C8R43DRAFT_820696, partial [Mycena crocata]